jgi:hypothetical protein
MPDHANPYATTFRLRRALAILAIVFGAMTIASGGAILFGPDAVQARAGNVIPYVLWFNFGAGFAYVAAGFGILTNRAWAFALSLAIAVSTLAAAGVFAIAVLLGAAFEVRTIGALALRFSIWAGISVALRPARA